jgi:hypothetical protein
MFSFAFGVHRSGVLAVCIKKYKLVFFVSKYSDLLVVVVGDFVH